MNKQQRKLHHEMVALLRSIIARYTPWWQYTEEELQAELEEFRWPSDI